MEVSQAEGVAAELLSVELDQLRVPFLGELPNDFAGDLHFYLHEWISNTALPFHIY